LLNRKHLLILLLRLEIVMISVLFVILFKNNPNQINLVVIFLIFRVIEACLGLSLLVKVVYYYGRDIIKNINLLC